MKGAGRQREDEVPVVAIGASWGGIAALRIVLGSLPAGLPAALCIVLHRAEHDGPAKLAAVLRRNTTLHVCEPDDKDEIRAGWVYVAPAGYHLLVEGGHLALSFEERVRFARPSVDVLFESVAAERRERAIGIVLTGTNDDGALGSKAIHEAGGTVLVQDPEQAERGDMPTAAIAATQVDAVLSLEQIAEEIVRRVGRTGNG